MPRRTAAADESAAPSFSFEDVAAAAVTAAPVAPPGKPNPFSPLVEAAAEDGQGRSFAVPAEHVKAAVNKVRNAARKLNLGVNVSEADGGDGNVTVTFSTRALRPHAKSEPVESDEVAEDDVDEDGEDL